MAWGRWREEAGEAAIGPLGQLPMGLASGELLEPSLEEGRRGREGNRKMEAKRSLREQKEQKGEDRQKEKPRERQRARQSERGRGRGSKRVIRQRKS